MGIVFLFIVHYHPQIWSRSVFYIRQQWISCIKISPKFNVLPDPQLCSKVNKNWWTLRDVDIGGAMSMIAWVPNEVLFNFYTLFLNNFRISSLRFRKNTVKVFHSVWIWTLPKVSKIYKYIFIYFLWTIKATIDPIFSF